MVACSGNGQRWRFFTNAEADLVEAITAQIVPTDGDPGAREAGVVRYIDKQLKGFFRRHQQTYREGLAAIEALAHPQRFVDLEFAAQTALLERVEKGSGAERRVFDLLVSHTMQGFYGDPRHGGNRNGVSWKMLGVPNPPVRGRGPFAPIGKG
jgi:gluconate 2-dehydrogenase gamma chain